MLISVYSKKEIESLETQSKIKNKHILLSISDTKDTLPNIPINNNRIGTFYMFFDDIEADEVAKPYQLFHKLQAESLLVYIDGMLEKHPEIAEIVIECTTGGARSSGMGYALEKILNNKSISLLSAMNIGVYNTLIAAYYDNKNKEVEYPQIAKLRKVSV